MIKNDDYDSLIVTLTLGGMLSKQLKLVSRQRAFLKLSYHSPLTTKLSNEISVRIRRNAIKGGGEGETIASFCQSWRKTFVKTRYECGTVQRSRAALTGYPHEMTAVNGDGAF